MADDVCFPWSLVDSTALMTGGTPLFFSVTASVDRFYDCVRFSGTGASMTSFYVSIFKITSADTLTKVVHLGNVKAQLSAAQTLQTIALPEPLDAVAGEMFYVGLLSVGGTAFTVHRSTLVATSSPGITSGLVPEWNQITAVGTTTSQTSFADTEAISGAIGTNSPRRIWGSLGNLAMPVRLPWFFVDSFNRGNASDLITPWGGNPAVPRFAIYNQTASPQTDASLGAYNYVIQAASSDNHYAQVRLGSDMSSDLAKDIDLYIGVRSSRGVSGAATKLHLNPSDGTFRIVTVTSSYDNGGLVERVAEPLESSGVPYAIPFGLAGTSGRVFDAGDTVKVVAFNTVYSAFHNDVPVCSWVDSGVIHPVDSDHRWVDIAAGQTTVPDLQVIDNFEAGDAVGGVQLVALSGIDSTAAVGVPTVQNNIALTPDPAVLTLTGNVPIIYGGVAAIPDPAEMTLTGNVPTIMIIEENRARSNQAVPSDTTGVWVTVVAGGGIGGAGRGNGQTSWTMYGGGGGGGGGQAGRTWIPVANLGSTYSTVRGGAGASSRFSSGDIVLTAFPGGDGGDGGSSAGASGTAGWYSVTGFNAIGYNGTPGALGGGPSGSALGAGSGNAGAGGGGGGGISFDVKTTRSGGRGGNSPTATGGVGGSASSSPVNGGSGGNGGGYSGNVYPGGGGGGGASRNSTSPGVGGNGGGAGGGGGGGGGTSWPGADGGNGGTGNLGSVLLEWLF